MTLSKQGGLQASFCHQVTMKKTKKHLHSPEEGAIMREVCKRQAYGRAEVLELADRHD